MRWDTRGVRTRWQPDWSFPADGGREPKYIDFGGWSSWLENGGCFNCVTKMPPPGEVRHHLSEYFQPIRCRLEFGKSFLKPLEKPLQLGSLSAGRLMSVRMTVNSIS